VGIGRRGRRSAEGLPRAAAGPVTASGPHAGRSYPRTWTIACGGRRRTAGGQAAPDRPRGPPTTVTATTDLESDDAMLEMLPGLVRIYEEWAERYPDVQPLTVQFAADGESGAVLDGVLAYPLDGHWLLVSFGLTELGEKTSGEARVSGAGFEFTCRVPREDGDEAVPAWALRVLHALADRFLAGSDLDVGHWIVTPAPLGGEPANGDMTSLVIVPDVEIRAMDTPNGIVLFFQLVGLKAEEGADVQKAGTAAPLVALLRDRDPKMLSDPSRDTVRI